MGGFKLLQGIFASISVIVARGQRSGSAEFSSERWISWEEDVKTGLGLCVYFPAAGQDRCVVTENDRHVLFSFHTC